MSLAVAWTTAVQEYAANAAAAFLPGVAYRYLIRNIDYLWFKYLLSSPLCT